MPLSIRINCLETLLILSAYNPSTVCTCIEYLINNEKYDVITATRDNLKIFYQLYKTKLPTRNEQLWSTVIGGSDLPGNVIDSHETCNAD